TIPVEFATELMFAATLGLLVLTVLERLRWRPSLVRKELHYLILLGDIYVISAVYLKTGNVRSDLYLLYFLPFLYAGEYFGVYAVILLFVGISGSFAYVLLQVHDSDPIGRLIVFITREVFFFAVLTAGALLIALTRLEREMRVHQMDAMLSFKEDVDQLS